MQQKHITIMLIGSHNFDKPVIHSRLEIVLELFEQKVWKGRKEALFCQHKHVFEKNLTKFMSHELTFATHSRCDELRNPMM